MIAAGQDYDVDLERDRFALDHSLRHLDPGERGVSSGRTLWAAFAHLVGEDFVVGYPTKGKEVLVASSREALLKDKVIDESPSMIAITHCFRRCSVLALGRSK